MLAGEPFSDRLHMSSLGFDFCAYSATKSVIGQLLWSCALPGDPNARVGRSPPARLLKMGSLTDWVAYLHFAALKDHQLCIRVVINFIVREIHKIQIPFQGLVV